MPWLAVRLEVEAGAAEALSEALLEHGAESVGIDNVDSPRPAVQALLPAHAEITAVLARVAEHLGWSGSPAYDVERIDDQDWVRRSQAQFAPVTVGERLWVGPSWCEPPPAAAAVRLDPGLAFGTGSHPSSRLVLGFLARRVRGGERVLDYGCGSGILALAAARLGAGQVVATDIDPVALETTAANARINGIALAVCAPEAIAPGSYDIVVANILAQPLIVLAPLLASRAAPGGRIALSGILEPQAGEVAEAYRRRFDVGVSCAEEGWVLLEGVRR